MRVPVRVLCAAALVCLWLGAGGPARAEAAQPVALSTSFAIGGAVRAPTRYTAETLKAQPATTAIVYFNTGKGPVSATFKGVLLWTLLQEAGIDAEPGVKNAILHRTVTVTGSDGYHVVLSGGELAPNVGGEPALVAYEQDGAPLAAEGGFARLVVPGDKTGGRAVSSIVSIEVR